MLKIFIKMSTEHTYRSLLDICNNKYMFISHCINSIHEINTEIKFNPSLFYNISTSFCIYSLPTCLYIDELIDELKVIEISNSISRFNQISILYESIHNSKINYILTDENIPDTEEHILTDENTPDTEEHIHIDTNIDGYTENDTIITLSNTTKNTIGIIYNPSVYTIKINMKEYNDILTEIIRSDELNNIIPTEICEKINDYLYIDFSNDYGDDFDENEYVHALPFNTKYDILKTKSITDLYTLSIKAKIKYIIIYTIICNTFGDLLNMFGDFIDKYSNIVSLTPDLYDILVTKYDDLRSIYDIIFKLFNIRWGFILKFIKDPSISCIYQQILNKLKYPIYQDSCIF